MNKKQRKRRMVKRSRRLNRGANGRTKRRGAK